MFKIGEFSKLSQVSIRMLRYYDETGLLTPARTDPFTNYRHYSAAQIPRLQRILFLRDLGFTVAEIAAALAQQSDADFADLLTRKEREIRRTVRAEQAKLAKIAQARRDIAAPGLEQHYRVTLKAVPSYRVLSLRRVVADYYAEGALWQELAAFAKARRIAVAASTFSIYHDLDYRESEVDIEICAPLRGELEEDRHGFVFRTTEAVPLVAASMVHGPFERIAGAYRALAAWLGDHSPYRIPGQSRQIVHRGPWNEDDAAQYLTEIQIPLAARA